MGHDPFSPVCLAQLNLLCVPAAKITKHRFEEFVNALRSCSSVRLKPTDEERTLDRANPTSQKARPGTVFLNISDRHVSDQDTETYLCDTNRDPQIILGLVDSEGTQQQVPSEYADQIQSLVIDFRDHFTSHQHAILVMVCVLGGNKLEHIDDCLWIDTEGSGPSLPDVVSHLVRDFHRALPVAVERLRSRNNTGTSNTSVLSRHASVAANGKGSGGNSATQDGKQDQTNLTLPRQSVISGLINLQAGRWDNAFLLFSDAATGARSNSDHVWHARALEGLLSCMLLFAWAHYDFEIPQVCYPSNEKHATTNYSSLFATLLGQNRPPSTSLFSNISIKPINALIGLLPHLVSSIIGLYEHATNVVEGPDVFTVLGEARIRWVNFFVTVKSNGNSLQDDALESMMQNQNVGNTHRPLDDTLSSLKLNNHILSDILVDTALAAQTRLPVQQVVTMQLAVARSLSLLRLERKQGLCLKQVLQLLIPALLEARRLGAAEIGVHPAANLPQLDNARSMRHFATGGGARELLKSIAELYGLPVYALEQHGNFKSPLEELKSSLTFWLSSRSDGDLLIKLEVLSLCIEVADAIPDPEGSLIFTSHLFQASRATITVSAESIAAEQTVASGELRRLQQNMSRAIGAAERFGLPGLRAHYWDKFLVRDVWFLEESDRLVPHTARDLSMAAIGREDGKRDPFIFNAFAKTKASSKEVVLAVGDLAHFTVVLQNPLDTEVDIEDVFLATEGCRFTPTHHNIVLGPLCSQAFTLTGKPDELGSLKVIGCTARLRNCHQETFLILPNQWKPAATTKLRTRSAAHLFTPQITMPNPKELLLKVIEPLPRLTIRSTSLTQSSLMMLEGENTEVALTCHNVSDIDIDFVLLTFEDTVTSRLHDALNNKALSPTDVYEIQHQVTARPPARWKKDQGQIRIPAGQSSTFILEIFGQPGLTEIQVLLNYAYLNKPKADITGIFYTRQLTYTLVTTVNGGVDVSRCTVLSSPMLLGQHRPDVLEEKAVSDTAADDSPKMLDRRDQCILSLDVRNVWPHPLQVDIRARAAPKDSVDEIDRMFDYSQTQDIIQPGQLTRLLLQIPRIRIQDPQAVVPNLDSNRQFVVSASKMSVEAEAASREAFWYRERLLGCLNGTWTEPGGKRKGQLDMRKAIRLAPRMIEALRLEHVEISMLLRSEQPLAESGDNTSLIRQVDTSVYKVPRNKFASLVTTIKNQSDQDLRLMLRLQPSLRHQPHNVALDISKYFGWTGVLQRVVYPPLKPGESRVLELGVVVLAVGEYEVNATVEEVQSVSFNEKSDLPAFGMSNERRLWHARNPCVIEVYD